MSGADSYWFTRGGHDHRAEQHRDACERNKQLKRIADNMMKFRVMAEVSLTADQTALYRSILAQYAQDKHEG